MDLELFSKYLNRANPAMKAIVELAKVIQEEENQDDATAIRWALQLCSTGINDIMRASASLGLRDQ